MKYRIALELVMIYLIYLVIKFAFCIFILVLCGLTSFMEYKFIGSNWESESFNMNVEVCFKECLNFSAHN